MKHLKNSKHLEKYILVILVILSILFTLGSFGFKFLKDRINVSMNTSNDSEIVNEVSDVVPTNLPEDTVFLESLDMMIKKLVSAKYNRDVNAITVEELQSDGTFVRGTYAVEGNDISTSYVAYFNKDKAQWEVLYEGLYEETPCDVLTRVNFPVGIMPDCFDATNGVLNSRL